MEIYSYMIFPIYSYSHDIPNIFLCIHDNQLYVTNIRVFPMISPSSHGGCPGSPGSSAAAGAGGAGRAGARWNSARTSGGDLEKKDGGVLDGMAMGQYLLIPFLGGWTSIYQLFWCSPGVLLVLTHCHFTGNSWDLPSGNEKITVCYWKWP